MIRITRLSRSRKVQKSTIFSGLYFSFTKSKVSILGSNRNSIRCFSLWYHGLLKSGTDGTYFLYFSLKYFNTLTCMFFNLRENLKWFGDLKWKYTIILGNLERQIFKKNQKIKASLENKAPLHGDQIIYNILFQYYRYSFLRVEVPLLYIGINTMF